MRETRNARKMLAGKSAMLLPLGRAMLTVKDDIEMDLEQGHRIWREFFWLRLWTASFSGRTQMQSAVVNFFEDRGSITGRCTNFLFDAGDQPPFLPKAVFSETKYP